MVKSLFFLLSLSFCVFLFAGQANKVKISQDSQQAIYQSNFECEEAFSTGSFQNCWLKLLRSDKPVKDIEIFIDGGMPAHQHGLPTSPKIVWSEDKQLYLIQGLKFSMPGEWFLNFKLNAKDDALKDQIKILFTVD